MDKDQVKRAAEAICAEIAERAAPYQTDVDVPARQSIPWTGDTTLPCAIEDGGYKHDIAGPDFQRVVNACIGMLNGTVRGLVIWGPTGRGKTCAAKAIAPGLLTKAYEGASEFCRPALVKPVRVDCYKIGSMDNDTRDQISNANGGNYWIEDAGVEPTVNAFGTRSDIIRNCIAALSEKPHVKFIITTNLDMQCLAQRYDERTVSRLCDSVGWLQLTGVDRRIENIVTF